METSFAPTITLTDLYVAEDFHALLLLVDTHAGPHCTSIEFRDDANYAGKRRLSFDVTTPCYTGYIDRDEDGPYRDTEPYRTVIYLDVDPNTDATLIAYMIASEVRGIDENAFA